MHAEWEDLLDVEEICESSGFFPFNEYNSKPAANIIAIDPLRLHFQLVLSPISVPEEKEASDYLSFTENLTINVLGRNSKNVVAGSIKDDTGSYKSHLFCLFYTIYLFTLF